MALNNYRGFNLKLVSREKDQWQVQIKNRVLNGSLTGIRKSVDWFCETASIIEPSEFASFESKRQAAKGLVENFHGFKIQNDTGEPNAWYCMFNGRLLKGGKPAIQKHIETTMLALKKQQAALQTKK
ncbi:DUF3319 domain-containing protein [Vibrio agarivorans]|uniref:DUF3319 domain-containing protein n=1 Tax=Vibrio agarivorans TaxID=153622 RepID=A0ABT7Y580_9VIBR|nr:DUF3319 domain-containing protein [Vibrio agarivorans]MDN2483208.1 DUF3319 domain-containing protein [Vibrio agarivorans]